jgi:hypothetical protein
LHRLCRPNGSQVREAAGGVTRQDLYGFRPARWRRSAVTCRPVVGIQHPDWFTAHEQRHGQGGAAFWQGCKPRRWHIVSRGRYRFATFDGLLEQTFARNADEPDVARESPSLETLHLVSVCNEQRRARRLGPCRFDERRQDVGQRTRFIHSTHRLRDTFNDRQLRVPLSGTRADNRDRIRFRSGGCGLHPGELLLCTRLTLLFKRLLNARQRRIGAPQGLVYLLELLPFGREFGFQAAKIPVEFFRTPMIFAIAIRRLEPLALDGELLPFRLEALPLRSELLPLGVEPLALREAIGLEALPLDLSLGFKPLTLRIEHRDHALTLRVEVRRPSLTLRVEHCHVSLTFGFNFLVGFFPYAYGRLGGCVFRFPS